MGMITSIDLMRDTFEAQFESVGDGKYLYRQNQKGEPIPVSAAERERFTREYVRRIWFIMGGMMFVLLAFSGLVFWRMVATNSDLPQFLLYAGIISIAAVGVTLMYRAGSAPARELAGRSAVGRERSRDEIRAIGFKKLTYGQLAATAAMGAILPFTLRTHPDLFHGWGRLWFVFGGGLVLLSAVQAFRKWRFESERGENT